MLMEKHWMRTKQLTENDWSWLLMKMQQRNHLKKMRLLLRLSHRFFRTQVQGLQPAAYLPDYLHLLVQSSVLESSNSKIDKRKDTYLIVCVFLLEVVS